MPFEENRYLYFKKKQIHGTFRKLQNENLHFNEKNVIVIK